MLVEVDVETTGKQAPQAHVIEVAAVVIDESYREIAHFESLANPGEEALRAADPEALRVNQITIEMIRQAPPAEIVAGKLNDFLDVYWGATFHAFNNEFDLQFLKLPPWMIRPRRWGECVMNAAMEFMARAQALRIRDDGKPKWPKLTEAAAFFKVPYEGGHRALHDCRVSGRIHAAILKEREIAMAGRQAYDEARCMLEHGL